MTGITGFIGRNLLYHLLKKYKKVINFTRNNTLQIYEKDKIDTSVYLPHVIQLYNELLNSGQTIQKSEMETRLNALRSEIENISPSDTFDKIENTFGKIVTKYAQFDGELNNLYKTVKTTISKKQTIRTGTAKSKKPPIVNVGWFIANEKAPMQAGKTMCILNKQYTLASGGTSSIKLTTTTNSNIMNKDTMYDLFSDTNNNTIIYGNNWNTAKQTIMKGISYYLSELLRRKILDIFNNNVVGIMQTAIDTFCNGDDKCTQVEEGQKPSEDAKSEMEEAKKIISENKKILEDYALKVCQVRRAEGYYINETLRQIRETIAETIMAKGEDMLYNSPDFIIQCKDDYCPDPNLPCFQLINKPLDNPKIQSIIFKDIYDYMKEINTDLTVKQFYKDIIVGIFCVLNISTGANNPPPVPYVDINQLKKAFFNKSKEYCVKDLIEQLTYRINRINNPLICKDNANSPECKGINLIVPEPTGSNYPVISFDNFTIEKQQTLVAIKISFNELSEDTNETDQIQKLIEEIDNFNAATAIGTLDFTDSVAKYNTVHNTCADNQDEKRESINKSIIFHANSYETKVINQKFGGSSKTKRNKKKRNNKTRKVK